MNTYLNLSDEDLMEKYKQGDNMAFNTIYARHETRVYTYVSKRLFDKDLINEVFQNIFLKLHKQKARYLKKFLFVKFLYTICRSELLDFLKKKKLDTQPFYENVFLDKNGKQDSTQSIELNKESSLSKKEQKALDLRYYSEKDFIEISKALGVSNVNVRKIISRGLKKLKIKYSGGYND
ncbi:MAG: sigma-70 family RNA polymerase sigma factor [Bdellovibrionales bacterium]|nr:sigma-70 family RNA polymerase sigma factor [Bdellovibrionales bacterium]